MKHSADQVYRDMNCDEFDIVELFKESMIRSRAKEIMDQASRINVLVGKLTKEWLWNQGWYNEEELKASKIYIVHKITQRNQSL